MNIIYGVSGEGLGHVFEAIEIATILQSDGHRVKILTYGERALRALRAFNPTEIEGIHLQFTSRGMSVWKTARTNYRILPFYLRHARRLRRELEAFAPDVFITAYEPYTTLMSHRLKRPLISMDNQNELLHVHPRKQGFAFDLELVRLATRVCTYGAAHYVVKTLHRPQRRVPHVHFVAPIIQREIRSLQPTNGDHVLVYLTKPNPELLAILQTLPGTYIVYCHGRTGTENNITFRAPGPNFIEDLRTCRAIIGTTGFSLIADSIYLRKPYYGVPLKKQFEQTHNAFFLRDGELGDFSENPTREDLLRFFSKLDDYRERLAAYNLDPAEQENAVRLVLAEVEARSRLPAAPHLSTAL